MSYAHWEINGNLDDGKNSFLNYDLFAQMIENIKTLFDFIFGSERLDKIDFLVDNATSGSGYTPICTPALGKIVIIKLGIGPNDSADRVVFQFAHELTHVVFYAYFGIDKPFANEDEEAICTAASLLTIKALCPDSYEYYENHLLNCERIGYRNGVPLAKELNFDFNELKKRIEAFHY